MFDRFPYTNLHNLNLDWIINKLKSVFSPENPPPYPVTSVNGETGAVELDIPSTDDLVRTVNGQTGDVTIDIPSPVVNTVNGRSGNITLSTFDDAYTELPETDNDTWGFTRDANGSSTGLLFDNDGSLYVDDPSGEFSYEVYTELNPPPYPVTSVNGKTGAVVTPFADPGAAMLLLETDTPGQYWGLTRRTLDEGKLSIRVTGSGVENPYVTLTYVSDDGTISKSVQLLSTADVPTESGVISINGLTGVVQIDGRQIYVNRSALTPVTISGVIGSGSLQTTAQSLISAVNELVTAKVNVTDIVNDLTTGGRNKPLSAEQGKALKTAIDAITVPDVVNNLTSVSTTDALSAAQGKVLKGLIDNIEVPDVINNLTSDSTTDALSAAQGKVLKTSKVDIAQGTTYSGKVLGINDAGNVTPIDPPAGVTVYNGLDSDSTTAALSAAQGKALQNNKVDKAGFAGLAIVNASGVVTYPGDIMAGARYGLVTIAGQFTPPASTGWSTVFTLNNYRPAVQTYGMAVCPNANKTMGLRITTGGLIQISNPANNYTYFNISYPHEL